MNREEISDHAKRLSGLPAELVATVGDLSNSADRTLLARIIYQHLSATKSDHFTSSDLEIGNCEEAVEFNWDMMDFMKTEFDLDLGKSKFCDVCLRTIYRSALREGSIRSSNQGPTD
jgi:hypothetical protein